MTEIYQSKPNAASARARKTAAEFEEIARDTPEAMRALAEKNIAQTQELYERSKQTLESVLDSWERSLDAAGQGAVALNRKVIEITQRNINSGFDLVKNLAAAKNLAEALELQNAYWRQQLGELRSQAEEVRTLSARVASDMAAPMKAQMSRGSETPGS